METTIIESETSTKFTVGTGNDTLTVSAHLIERTGKWQVNWSAYGDMLPAVAFAYSVLIYRAAEWCDTKNKA